MGGRPGLADTPSGRSLTTPNESEMKVLLHSIERRDDGNMDVMVSFGADSPKTYFASYDGSDEKHKVGGTDQELFMMLSDTAHKRFGNCAVYQMELMLILGAFDRGGKLPELPARLGTTAFCELKPSRLRIAWNKLLILLMKLGIRRPNVWVHPDYRNFR